MRQRGASQKLRHFRRYGPGGGRHMTSCDEKCLRFTLVSISIGPITSTHARVLRSFGESPPHGLADWLCLPAFQALEGGHDSD
jgi:hypothetical protein